eukprot:216074_1
MAVYYDKPLEVKNKWQNQRIAKHFKNHANQPPLRRYRAVKTAAVKIDMADHQMCVDYNSVPVWHCTCCTYRNVERKPLCQMCSTSYAAISTNKYEVSCGDACATTCTSNEMTLGEFCKNVWDALSIPVWICSQCTYCNVEQMSRCQMCSNPYRAEEHYEFANNMQTTSTTEERFVEIYEEFYVEDDMETDNLCKHDELKRDILPTTPKAFQPQNKGNCDLCDDSKVNVSVTIKLTAGKLYQKEKSQRLQLKNEDVLRHTLLEVRLDIERVNTELIKSYDYIPAIKNSDDTFTAYHDNVVIVPIKYKYRNQFGEFGYYCNNAPLKCIGEFVWKAQFPYLDAIHCPDWKFEYPEDKNVRSPAQKQYILNAILTFLPLKDVVKAILFRYLGYDEIDVVKLHTTFDHEVSYFQRYKNKHFEMDLFMGRNNDRLPFTIQSNRFTTIKSRKINKTFKLTEIGYRYNYSGETQYWLNNSKKERLFKQRWASTWCGWLDLLEKKYGTRQVRNRHDRKMKRRRNAKTHIVDIKRFWPKKYLYLRKNGGVPRPRKRQRNKRRKYAKYCSRYGYDGSHLRNYRNDTNPRYSNETVRWYLQKDKRYTERKWSAYWKLNER